MDNQPPVLLAVFAHPDDESFRCGGTMALLAQRGIQVHLLTATRGEAGSCGEPPLCRTEDLGSVREQELRCACKVLGIEQPDILNYRDGELANANEKKAVDKLAAKICELQPQVLLTWPSNGLSGHPDHIAVSRWTTLAYEVIAKVLKNQIALYYLALPISVADKLNMPRLFSVPDEEISLSVDVSKVWEQKLAAIMCHRTQAGNTPILAADEKMQRLFLEIEHFTLASANTKSDFLENFRVDCGTQY